MTFDRLQAPEEDGEWLAHPDPGDWRRLLDCNRRSVESSNSLIAGLPWAEWRSLVRSEVAAAAAIGEEFGAAPLIVSGHQPELFHPGVWVKNFAATGFARTVGGVPVHVVADTDLLKRTTVAVPGGTPESPLVAHLPFDQWTGEEPFEDRPVRDEGAFRGFGDSAAQYLGNLPFQTIFPAFWRRAADPSEFPIGERFASARRSLEGEWGAGAWEATVGRCCRPPLRGFLLLAADVMLRAAEYRGIYNEELWAFRRKHKVRSAHHPAPELEAGDAGVEAPFWAWKPGGRRQRPFVQRSGSRLQLTGGGEMIVDVDVSSSNPIERLADALAGQGPWKVRPRALMTMAFLRLGLADLFIHGLGGAKYDEWNDAVIRRFWNLEPQAYVMLTATRRLPFSDIAEPAFSLVELRRQRRDLEWNPERFIDDSLLERSPLCDWVEEKSALCEADLPTKKERRARFRRLRELNERLREFVAARLRETNEDLRKAKDAAAAKALMGSREFFFGFHPPKSLQSLFAPWLDWTAVPAARGCVGPPSL